MVETRKDYTRTYTPTHQIGPIKYEQRDDSFRRPTTPTNHYPTQFSTPTPSASSQYTAAVLGQVSQSELKNFNQSELQVNRPKYDEWLKVEVCREFQRDKCNRKPVSQSESSILNLGQLDSIFLTLSQ